MFSQRGDTHCGKRLVHVHMFEFPNDDRLIQIDIEVHVAAVGVMTFPTPISNYQCGLVHELRGTWCSTYKM